MESMLSFPKQFRSSDTRPEEALRALDGSRGTAQHWSKFLCPFRGAIGQAALRLRPYKLNQIELRDIPVELFHVEARVAIQEVTDWFSLCE